MTCAQYATRSPWRGVALLMTLVLIGGCSGSDHAPTAFSLRPPTINGSAWQVADAAQVAAAPTLPTKPDGPTVDVPASIDHSCNSDVTAALGDFLNAAHDNSTIKFQQAGCYRVDGTLTLDTRHRLDIEGNGSTLRATTVGDRGRKGLVISSSDDIIVRDLIITGSNDRAGATPEAYDATLAFQHAFALDGDHRVLLEHVGAGRMHGDFVRIGGVLTSPSNDITVATSTFDGSGRQGIAIVDAQRVLIVDNDITNVARSMFDIEPNSPNNMVRDVRITGNRTGPATNFWIADKGAGGDVGAIEIDGNTMQQATGGLVFAFAPSVARRGPWIVRGNQLIASNAVHDEGSVGAFLFASCDHVLIINNHVTFPPGGVMPAVELRASRDVHIVGNDFTGASQPITADGNTSGVNTSS